MRQKWNKQQEEPADPGEGQPIPQKIVLFPDVTYRLKSTTMAPSRQAIDTYNNIPMSEDSTIIAYDNLGYIPQNGDPYASNFSTMSSTRPLNGAIVPLGHIYTGNEAGSEYCTIRSSSGGTNAGSQTDITGKDQGSTASLVRPKFRDKCSTCLRYVETVLCTISLSCGLGNVYRLPQVVLTQGGLPFLIAYIILAILIGLPLLILEIGLGQIVQEGFMKTWRAVPFFRGVGYIKFLAGCLLSLYYSLYTGLAIYYVVWSGKDSIPFRDCAEVRMGENGYTTYGISGQECVKKTFLESPFKDTFWFGIFIAILACVWLITILCLIKRTKTYVKALVVFLVCTFGCIIALIVRAVNEESNYHGIAKFGQIADWKIFTTADVWYYAAIQMFFSTHLGFGIFVTNAGIILKKVNPVWTGFGYILINLTVGTVCVLLCYTFVHSFDHPIPQAGDITQVTLLTVIYDIALANDSVIAWPLIAYMCIVFAGFISMTTLMYTIVKAIRLESRKRWYWWQVCMFYGIIGLACSCLILLKKEFQIVHMFDHYIVGNVVLVSVIVEILAVIGCYGSKRIQSDFEFILGRKLPVIYISLWWLSPFVICGIFVWSLVMMTQITGYLEEDPLWVYATGWGIVLSAIVFVLVMGLYQASKQDDYYTFGDKLKAALKFSRKWGPVDPIMRYNWVQWHSKAKDGQRDFTLRRRGTREYTHSVKNRSKYSPRKYVPAASESSVNTDSIAFRKNDQNQNNITLMNLSSYNEPYFPINNIQNKHLPANNTAKPLRVTSLIDTLEPTTANGAAISRRAIHTYYGGPDYKISINPLANINQGKIELQSDGGTSEGYGTFRNGPYVIDGEEVDHVCHRRPSGYSEEATEL